jgi:hypothetical protein
VFSSILPLFVNTQLRRMAEVAGPDDSFDEKVCIVQHYVQQNIHLCIALTRTTVRLYMGVLIMLQITQNTCI